MVSSKPTVYLAVDGKGQPHVDLANLGDGDEAVFTNRWGPLCAANPVWDNTIMWRENERLGIAFGVAIVVGGNPALSGWRPEEIRLI